MLSQIFNTYGIINENERERERENRAKDFVAKAKKRKYYRLGIKMKGEYRANLYIEPASNHRPAMIPVIVSEVSTVLLYVLGVKVSDRFNCICIWSTFGHTKTYSSNLQCLCYSKFINLHIYCLEILGIEDLLESQ